MIDDDVVVVALLLFIMIEDGEKAATADDDDEIAISPKTRLEIKECMIYNLTFFRVLLQRKCR